MQLKSWLKSIKQPRNSAISLDIGTEFIKALIFQVENEKAKVLGVGRQRQRLSDMQGGTVTDISGVIKSCLVALERAVEQAGFLPESVIIGIAGELVKGTTTIVAYTRPEPKKKIDFPEMQEIVNKVQRRAAERARQVLAWETGHDELDVKLVNAAVVDVKIDGYRVTNPLNFQGREIEIGVFNAFAPIVHLGALQTVAEELDLSLLSIAAEPYAVARCFIQEESSEFSAIFIDVGGGTTDIALVSAGGLEGTKMFALGGRAFTKRLAGELGMNFAAAEEVKLNYSAGKLKADLEKRVRMIVQSDIQTWLSGIELTLGEFTVRPPLPSRILLCGGGSALPEIAAGLKEHQWPAEVGFSRQPSVHFLQPKDIVSVIDTTGQLTEPRDITPMALANLAIELLGGSKLTDRVLNRLLKSLRT